MLARNCFIVSIAALSLFKSTCLQSMFFSRSMSMQFSCFSKLSISSLSIMLFSVPRTFFRDPNSHLIGHENLLDFSNQT